MLWAVPMPLQCSTRVIKPRCAALIWLFTCTTTPEVPENEVAFYLQVIQESMEPLLLAMNDLRLRRGKCEIVDPYRRSLSSSFP